MTGTGLRTGSVGKGIAAAALLFLAAVADTGKGAGMDGKRATPPIDGEIPARVETATFAVG